MGLLAIIYYEVGLPGMETGINPSEPLGESDL